MDDVEAGILAVNKLLSDRGLKKIGSREEYQNVFGFPIIKYYEKLGFDFEKESYEALAPIWVEQYLLNVRDSKMFYDVKQTLEYFKGKGIKQIVLSATERKMLMCQLDGLGISHYFEEVLGLDDIHAFSKLSLAQNWREAHPESEVIFIGDTDHDHETADVMKAECFLIARGHQSYSTLSKLDAHIFCTLEEFLENTFD